MHSWLKVPFYLALGRVHKQQHCFSQKELIIEINYCFFQTTAISPQCLDVKNIFLACCFYVFLFLCFYVFMCLCFNQKRAGFWHDFYSFYPHRIFWLLICIMLYWQQMIVTLVLGRKQVFFWSATF